MIIALALLFLAEAPQTMRVPEAESGDNEIVVMARKSRQWQGTYSTLNGEVTCQTNVSSGDPEIDAIGCTSLKLCGPQYEPEMYRLIEAAQRAGKAKARADARRISMPAIKKMQHCMSKRWLPALHELKQRRRDDAPFGIRG